METLPSDDRAPDPAARGRRLPRGAWFAIALAIVVLAIAAYQATGSSTADTGSPGGVAVLDNTQTEPTDPVNPLLPSGSDLVGQPAPDVEITRFDGSPLTLADYAGTPLVVNFWAQYCVPCRAEMPDLERVHQTLGDRVAFLGVDTAESIDIGRPFAEQSGVTYDLASDPQGRMAAAFRASGLPTTVLIRADGTIARIRNAGTVSAEELQGWIEQDLLPVIDAPLAYAFGVGMVATVNPCGFAMLPAYLSFFLGLEEADDDTRGSVLHALVIGGTVTAGFLVVFGLLGILLDGALSSLQDWLPWVTIVLGFVLVGLGIALLAGRSFALRIPTPRQREGSQLLSVFVFGVSYALVSLSCTIPLFIAAVAPSFADANFASGVAAFLAYGLGMGVVLIALTVALALAKHSLVRNLRKVLPYVYKVSGVLLIVAGLYVSYYGWYELRVRTGETSGGGAAQVVFDWNASISSWVQQIGPVRLGIVLAAAVGVVVALTMGTRRRPEP